MSHMGFKPISFCFSSTRKLGHQYIAQFDKLRHGVSNSCSPHVLCQRHNPLCGLIHQAATQCLSTAFAECSVSTPQCAVWAHSTSCDTVSVTRARRKFCVNATMRCVGWFNKLRHGVCHSCSPHVVCQRHKPQYWLTNKLRHSVCQPRSPNVVSTPQCAVWADSKSCDTVSVTPVRRNFCVNATMHCAGWFNKLQHTVCHSLSPHVLCRRHNPTCGLIQQAATQCLSLVFAACSVSTPQSAVWADSTSRDTVSVTLIRRMFCVNATVRYVGWYNQLRHSVCHPCSPKVLCQRHKPLCGLPTTTPRGFLVATVCRITLFTSVIMNRDPYTPGS